MGTVVDTELVVEIDDVVWMEVEIVVFTGIVVGIDVVGLDDVELVGWVDDTVVGCVVVLADVVVSSEVVVFSDVVVETVVDVVAVVVACWARYGKTATSPPLDGAVIVGDLSFFDMKPISWFFEVFITIQPGLVSEPFTLYPGTYASAPLGVNTICDHGSYAVLPVSVFGFRLIVVSL